MVSFCEFYSSRCFERYEKAAFSIAAQAMEDGLLRQRLVDCEPAGVSDEDCARKVLQKLGFRIFRRPLKSE